MRWEHILEAPLADLQAFGDPDKPGSFQKDDLKAINNPKWRNKVFRMFQRTPFIFNVYLYNAPGGIAPLGRKSDDTLGEPIDVRTLDDLEDYMGLQSPKVLQSIIGTLPPNLGQSITVLLVENEGDDGRVPLTPWMLGHRIAHALQSGSSEYSPKADAIDHLNMDLFGCFDQAISAAAAILARSSRFAGKIASKPETDMQMKAVAYELCDFASARSRNLVSETEAVADLTVQYLVKGKVTFLRPVLAERALAASLDRTLAEHEGLINECLAELFEACVGNIFLM